MGDSTKKGGGSRLQQTLRVSVVREVSGRHNGGNGRHLSTRTQGRLDCFSARSPSLPLLLHVSFDLFHLTLRKNCSLRAPAATEPRPHQQQQPPPLLLTTSQGGGSKASCATFGPHPIRTPAVPPGCPNIAMISLLLNHPSPNL